MSDDNDPVELIQTLQNHFGSVLSEWEAQFLEDVKRKLQVMGVDLTARQRVKLDEIWEAHTRRGQDGGQSFQVRKWRE